MNSIGGSTVWKTAHKPATPRRSVVGTPTLRISHAAPPERLRRVGDLPPVHADDSARALLLRDAERARQALWADCERRPIANDAYCTKYAAAPRFGERP